MEYSHPKFKKAKRSASNSTLSRKIDPDGRVHCCIISCTVFHSAYLLTWRGIFEGLVIAQVRSRFAAQSAGGESISQEVRTTRFLFGKGYGTQNYSGSLGFGIFSWHMGMNTTVLRGIWGRRLQQDWLKMRAISQASILKEWVPRSGSRRGHEESRSTPYDLLKEGMSTSKVGWEQLAIKRQL